MCGPFTQLGSRFCTDATLGKAALNNRYERYQNDEERFYFIHFKNLSDKDRLQLINEKD
jgi:hypothetical protein